MLNRINPLRWLYLLTVIVLLMQSFAIWHDVSHPFHIASDQCQRFESVSHTPTLDLAPSIIPQLTAQTSVAEPIMTTIYASKYPRKYHAIRAPPVFS